MIIQQVFLKQIVNQELSLRIQDKIMVAINPFSMQGVTLLMMGFLGSLNGPCLRKF